jgi:hypothetical protein
MFSNSEQTHTLAEALFWEEALTEKQWFRFTGSWDEVNHHKTGY